MRIEIPGYKTMDLKYLILDYNGTIAKDGIIPESVKERLKKLSGIYEIYVLTADTHGTARKICEGLPLKIQTFPGNAAAEEKRKIGGNMGIIGRHSFELCSRPRIISSASYVGDKEGKGPLRECFDKSSMVGLDRFCKLVETFRIVISEAVGIPFTRAEREWRHINKSSQMAAVFSELLPVGEHGRAAHGPAHEQDILQSQVFNDFMDVLCHAVDGVSVKHLGRPAMSPHIHGNDFIPVF